MTRPTAYLGIDPGSSSGGLAIVCGPEVRLAKMPPTEQDLWAWIAAASPDFALIEKVHAMPGNGVSSMFKFGQNYGSLRMALTAGLIPFEDVQPTAWQRGLKIPPKRKEMPQNEWKQLLRAHAQRLFPRETVTKEVADALLIAEFCRRSQEGRL